MQSRSSDERFRQDPPGNLLEFETKPDLEVTRNVEMLMEPGQRSLYEKTSHCI
jgi:hypothetical protein